MSSINTVSFISQSAACFGKYGHHQAVTRMKVKHPQLCRTEISKRQMCCSIKLHNKVTLKIKSEKLYVLGIFKKLEQCMCNIIR